MTEPVLEVEDIAVVHGPRTVLEVDRLAVHARETLTIVGPNGAGKSTLLRVLALLEVPTRGTVRFAGTPVQYRAAHLLPLRRRMASVFQAPLLCDTTVYENVALGLRFRGLPSAEIDRLARPWLHRFGIEHLATRAAKTLSGGESQRTSLARAFAMSPEVLFLDEPFSALDPPTRDALMLDVQGALRESSTTAVFVTHDRTEAQMFGDRVAVVVGGRILDLDVPERVFFAPASEEVARFVGVAVIVPAQVRARRGGLCVVTAGTAEILVPSDAAPGEHLLVCLRPEDVVLAPVDGSLASASTRNVLLGKVRRIVSLGSQARVEVDAGFDLRAVVQRQALRDLALAEGQEVRACFDVEAVHAIRAADIHDRGRDRVAARRSPGAPGQEET